MMISSLPLPSDYYLRPSSRRRQQQQRLPPSSSYFTLPPMIVTLMPMLLTIIIIMPPSSSMVMAIQQSCPNGHDDECPGVEQCHHHVCECPLMGLSRDGIFCTQDVIGSSVNTDNTSLWSTNHHCEYLPMDLYPVASGLFWAQGLLLHGTILIWSVIGIIQLRRHRRFSNNLQTIAVALMLLNGLLYTIHYSLNPVGGRRRRFEMLMLSYTPAPIAITLYNVVLLFLRDITATQLNTTPEVYRRVLALVFISLMLFIALIVIIAQASLLGGTDIFYYVFWLIYLVLSLIPATRMAIKLKNRLALPRVTSTPMVPAAPPPAPAPSRVLPLMMLPIPLPHRTPGGDATVAAAARELPQQSLALSPQPQPPVVTVGDGQIVLKPFSSHVASSRADELPRLAAQPNRFIPLPLSTRAIGLRRRILRFMYGSLFFSIMWAITLVIGVLINRQRFSQQISMIFIFRVFEVGWCVLMLKTFMPYRPTSRVAPAAAAAPPAVGDKLRPHSPVQAAGGAVPPLAIYQPPALRIPPPIQGASLSPSDNDGSVEGIEAKVQKPAVSFIESTPPGVRDDTSSPLQDHHHHIQATDRTTGTATARTTPMAATTTAAVAAAHNDVGHQHPLVVIASSNNNNNNNNNNNSGSQPQQLNQSSGTNNNNGGSSGNSAWSSQASATVPRPLFQHLPPQTFPWAPTPPANMS